jgi:hypothetical protein
MDMKYDFWSIYTREQAYKYFFERGRLSNEEYAEYEKAREKCLIGSF